MTFLASSRVRSLASAIAWPLLSTLSLGACGGSEDTDGGAEEPLAPVEALAGDWVQKGCVGVGGQSYRKFLRATLSAANTLDYSEGVLTYGGADCAGSARLTGPSRMGRVSFDRSQSNAQLVAHWGDFATITGQHFAVIWTLGSGPRLCLLGDEKPSIQPTLEAVAASLATVPPSSCFVR